MTLASPEQVLTTLAADGSRRWIDPRLSKGRFLNRRRVVAYFLMALFFVLPFVRSSHGIPTLGFAGKPLFLLDIVHRKFTLFGYTFLPTDTFLLALAMLFVFVSIFLFTAIFGRLWCGWACPQTVYLEFLYRPLQRVFDGTAGRGGARKKKSLARSAGYFVAAMAVTVVPAHTFLAYFVGVEQLSHWMRESPLQHPTAFLVMAATSVLMMFDFYWFREQMCAIACPYGRFQSVLLDKASLIVSYDRGRGEPRGKAARAVALPQAASRTGDCVDCGLCVATCPTGIDIREGLQMECVNCTQCMDACDAVMTKINRPRGLIRYSSQAAMEAAEAGTAAPKGRGMRFRVVFYPALLLVLAAGWIVVFSAKGTADVAVLRSSGSPYTVLSSGRIANPLRLKITNRTDAPATYRFELMDLPEGTIDASDTSMSVPAGGSQTLSLAIEAPASAFAGGEATASGTLTRAGQREVHLRITDQAGGRTMALVKLLGPAAAGDGPHEEEHMP